MLNKFVDIYNHALNKRGFDYNQINNSVFIGTNMCCQYGFEKELFSQGIIADISIEKEKIDSPEGVSYFLWLPTEDHQAPTQDKLDLGAQTINFLITKKIKLYIHCKNGHGRAPTVFIAYLIQYQGMGIDEAIQYVKEKRNSIHINDIQYAALREFQKRVSKYS